MKKANNKEIAKLFGYFPTAFTKWKQDETLKTRFAALKTIATLEKNGVDWRNIEAILADKDWKIKTLNDSISSTISFINGIREAEKDKR